MQAASAAHSSRDGGAYAGRPIATPAPGPSKRPKPSGDKWANYTSAADLGIDTPAESSFEIEQLVRGRTTSVGAWEDVAVPSPAQVAAEAEAAANAKRKAEEDPEDLREFKLAPKRHADPYDDDDWDPASLASLRFRTKERKGAETDGAGVGAGVGGDDDGAAGLGRGGWTQAGNVKTEPPEASVKSEPGAAGRVKTEPGEPGAAKAEPVENGVKVEPTEPDAEQHGETRAEHAVKAEHAAPPPPASGGSLFKKRRPPPSSRKK